ncbi:hypothetical protein Q8A73_007154 [Channa argus]|nr:hypothetical protein Q8A73_007154 [Channa argus]
MSHGDRRTPPGGFLRNLTLETSHATLPEETHKHKSFTPHFVSQSWRNSSLTGGLSMGPHPGGWSLNVGPADLTPRGQEVEPPFHPFVSPERSRAQKPPSSSEPELSAAGLEIFNTRTKRSDATFCGLEVHATRTAPEVNGSELPQAGGRNTEKREPASCCFLTHCELDLRQNRFVLLVPIGSQEARVRWLRNRPGEKESGLIVNLCASEVVTERRPSDILEAEEK